MCGRPSRRSSLRSGFEPAVAAVAVVHTDPQLCMASVQSLLHCSRSTLRGLLTGCSSFILHDRHFSCRRCEFLLVASFIHGDAGGARHAGSAFRRGLVSQSGRTCRSRLSLYASRCLSSRRGLWPLAFSFWARAGGLWRGCSSCMWLGWMLRARVVWTDWRSSATYTYIDYVVRQDCLVIQRR